MAESKPEDLTLPKPEFRKTKIKIGKITVKNLNTGEQKTLYPYILDERLISVPYIEYVRDSKKKPCRYRPWSFRDEFLKYYEAYEDRFNFYKMANKIHKCPICKDPEYEDEEPKIYYNYDYKVPYCWGSLTYHMIKKHYFEPPSSFIRNILSFSHYGFLKLDINDLNIFQGLVHVGSKPKFKYIEKTKEKIEAESDDKEEYGKKEKAFGEYVGYFITDHENENKIFCNIKNIVIVNDQRIINNDTRPDKIYYSRVPISNFIEKKYSFHTHPLTYDTNYQFYIIAPFLIPSKQDIAVFIDFIKHYGNEIEGHLIFAYEGTYFITEKNKARLIGDFDAKKDNLYANEKGNYMIEIRKKYHNLIKTKNDYFQLAYKDRYLIQEMNKILSNYNIRVVFYPKELTEKNEWEFGTIYLPYTNKIKPELKTVIVPEIKPEIKTTTVPEIKPEIKTENKKNNILNSESDNDNTNSDYEYTNDDFNIEDDEW